MKYCKNCAHFKQGIICEGVPVIHKHDFISGEYTEKPIMFKTDKEWPNKKGNCKYFKQATSWTKFKGIFESTYTGW